MSRRIGVLLRGAAIVAIGAAFVTTYPIGSASALSLEEAVQAAVDTYPEIHEARENRRAIDEELTQAKSRYLPTLDLAAAVGPEYSDNPTTRSTGDGDPVWMRRTESSLTLTETLFDGFEREGEIDRQEARVNSAVFRLHDRAESIALDVVNFYVDVIRQQEVVALAEENVKAHQSILDAVQRRVDGGQSGIGDAQQARTRHANARATLAQALRDLDEARIRFQRFVGQPPENLTAPAFDAAQLPADLDQAITVGLQSRPSVKFAEADAKAAEAGIEIAKARYYPTIDVAVGGSRNWNIDGVRGEHEDFSALLRLRYNLYNGGADRSRAREAMKRHGQARSTVARRQREMEEDIRQSWSAMERKDMEKAARGEQVVASREVVATYRDEFDVGRRDLLDLLDSENELFNTQTQAVTAENAALFARYRVLASIGQLTKVMNTKLPEEGAIYE